MRARCSPHAAAPSSVSTGPRLGARAASAAPRRATTSASASVSAWFFGGEFVVVGSLYSVFLFFCHILTTLTQKS